MRAKTKKETIRVRYVAGLHGAIEYFDTMYGLEGVKATLPDGLPLVSVTYLRRTMENGTITSELVLSDRWPRGAVESKTYEIYRVTDDED